MKLKFHWPFLPSLPADCAPDVPPGPRWQQIPSNSSWPSWLNDQNLGVAEVHKRCMTNLEVLRHFMSGSEASCCLMGLGRTGQPAARHGSRVIASLARPLAPVARNSDYPTAPEHQSYTRNVQEAHMGPELGDGSFCSTHKIPLFFVFCFRGWKVQLCVCFPCSNAPVPQHQRTGAGKTQTTLQS